MLVSVNGEQRAVPDGATVAEVVRLLGDPRAGRGVAVALGGEVVPRTAWERTQLREGESVEVVAAVQGG